MHVARNNGIVSIHRLGEIIKILTLIFLYLETLTK